LVKNSNAKQKKLGSCRKFIQKEETTSSNKRLDIKRAVVLYSAGSVNPALDGEKRA